MTDQKDWENRLEVINQLREASYELERWTQLHTLLTELIVEPAIEELRSEIARNYVREDNTYD